MNSSKVSKESLIIDSALASFIENDVLEGLNIDPNKFWSNFEQFLKEYSLLANQFLKTRDDIQSQIDQWHIDHKGCPHDQEEYESFLVDIGYILPRPVSVSVNTSNVDPEIANIAAPQLVVPIDNARYALNAANARWGSLYDALYGTDVISEDDGATRDGPYNPRRGDKVIAYSKGLLDGHFPLTSASHVDSIKYSIVAGELSVDTPEGNQRLADPSQFVGLCR